MKKDAIKLETPLDKLLRRKVEPFTFEVGILKNSNHRLPKGLSKRKKKTTMKSVLKSANKILRGKNRPSNIGTYAGGPVRRMGGPGPMSVAEVSAEVRINTGINVFIEPFKKKNSEANRFIAAFLELCFAQNKVTARRRTENLLQACVRNPILRKQYGRNKKLAKKLKGFDRKFIDTGQFFKSITAKVLTKAIRR